MHTTIITGINGFVGQHVAREMKESGVRVLGVGSSPRLTSQLKPFVDQYYQADLTQAGAAKEVPFAEANSIINLAGLTNVGESYNKALLYEVSNRSIIKNICDVLLAKESQARLLVISSGAVYDPLQPTPFTETTKLVSKDMTSPYTKSKLIMEECAQEYVAKGVQSYIVRPFNHIGPGQQPGFLVPDLASKINEAVASGNMEIVTGNLDNKRDFTDVRDVAKAYRVLALAKQTELRHHVYNVCSGKGLSGREILDQLLGSLAAPKIELKTDPKLLRNNDPKLLIGSAHTLHEDTGWEPTIPISQTVADFVAWLKSSS